MSALMNCCITLSAPEYGGLANGGVPDPADFEGHARHSLLALARHFERLAGGQEPGATGENSVFIQKGSTAAAPVAATGTITMATSSGTVGATIGGTLVTVTWATSDEHSQVLLASAINADSTVNKWVYATAAAKVCTLTALQPGVLGNNVTLVLSGTNVTVSGAKLTGGVGANQVGSVAATGAALMSGSVAGTVGLVINGVSTTVTWGTSDTATALALCKAINAVADLAVSAISTAGAIGLTSRQPGRAGNLHTVVAVGAGMAVTQTGSRQMSGGTGAGISTTLTF